MNTDTFQHFHLIVYLFKYYDKLGEKIIEAPELQAMIRSFSLNPEWFELFCYTLYIAHQYKYIFKKYFNSLISLILISKGSFTMKMKISLTSNIIEVRQICYVEMTCRYAMHIVTFKSYDSSFVFQMHEK